MANVGFRIIKHVERPPAELVARVARYRSCDLSDAMKKAGTMVGLKPVFLPIPPAVGPAVTVSVPAGGINMIKAGMELTREGDVLVVNVQGNTSYAVWGGNISLGMHSRGLRGLVIDGAIRDPSELRALPFPAWSRGIATASGAVEAPAGEVNVPIACGGTVVNPGDIVVADEDGIVVVPPRFAEEIMTETDRLLAYFASLRPVLASGAVTNIEKIMSDFRERGIQESE